MSITVGIDKIGLYIPQHYVDTEDLANARGVDPDKYLIGIGQEKMAVPLLEQDIVALAANAAKEILTDEDLETIDQIIFATESSFDFSKASAIYLHELLNIQPYAKGYEIKQACYGTTAGIQSACDYVQLRPQRKVLVVSADIARYGLDTSGEVTQGAGAVAILITANPSILAINQESISVTSNQFDFWRPHYSDVALVDGPFSTQLYQDLYLKVMERFEEVDANYLQTIKAMVFHLPFTKMGKKALDKYAESKSNILDDKTKENMIRVWQNIYPASTVLNRQVGNLYTGSLYLSLISLLIFAEELNSGDVLGLFSYGSGAVAELITGILQPQYLDALDKNMIIAHFDRREKLSIEAYEEIFSQSLTTTEEVVEVSEGTDGEGFYLSRIDAHRRYYAYKS